MIDRRSFMAMTALSPATVTLRPSEALAATTLPPITQIAPLQLNFTDANVVSKAQVAVPYQAVPQADGTVALVACGTNIANEQSAMVQATNSTDIVNLKITPLQVLAGATALNGAKWYGTASVGIAQRLPLPTLNNSLTWTNVWTLIPAGKHNLVPKTNRLGVPTTGATFDFMPLPSGDATMTLNFTTGTIQSPGLATFQNLLADIIPLISGTVDAGQGVLPIPAASFAAAIGYLNFVTQLATLIGNKPSFTEHISGDTGIAIAAHSKASNAASPSALRVPRTSGVFVLVPANEEESFRNALGSIKTQGLKLTISTSGLIDVVSSAGAAPVSFPAFEAINKVVIEAIASTV